MSDYKKLYEIIREEGFIEEFETQVPSFFMGIASTYKCPMSGESLLYDIESGIIDKNVPMLPESKECIKELIKPDDELRYHAFSTDIALFHYIYLIKGDLGGRAKGEFADVNTGISTIIKYNLLDKDTDEPVHDDIEVVMVIGGSALNDTTVGITIKHEFTHVLISRKLDELKKNKPDVIDKIHENISDDEWEDYIEFLCEFIQYDVSNINRYTINPVDRFMDEHEDVLRPEFKDKFNKFIAPISEFYNEKLSHFKKQPLNKKK